MPSSPPDTSSISFTALYTGQVWYRHGLSPASFRTRRGALLYWTMAPFEWLGQQLVGGNVRTFLLQRHLLMDALLRTAIEEQGVTQILELACGLSSRGYRFCRDHPTLRYVEADLPDMARRKQALLQRLHCLHEGHRVDTVNILQEQGPDAVESLVARHFDRQAPLLIITEGLVNYFPLSVVRPFWQRLARLLCRFPQGIYLTDNYPLLPDHPFHRTLTGLRHLLGWVSRSEVSFHFDSDPCARQTLEQCGFTEVQVLDPHLAGRTLMLPRARGPSLVRVMVGQTDSGRIGAGPNDLP